LDLDIKNLAQAHWLTRQFIGWPVDFNWNAAYSLNYSPIGAIHGTQDGLQGGVKIPLKFVSNSISDDLATRFPHLRSARMLKIPDEYLEIVPEILKGQFTIQAVDGNGIMLGLTALQIPGVLDDLYTNDEPLGVVWKMGVPTIRVWAPTAKSVRIQLFQVPPTAPESESSIWDRPLSFEMVLDLQTGIWSVTGRADWKGWYYLFEVDVFVRQEGKVVTNLVTDPYSLSLSINSNHSQIVCLDDPTLMPEGWKNLEKPVFENFTDLVLYELHIRDFSIRDETVPEEHRGTFMAFTHTESLGMQHLRWLSDQGVTHIHLLPVFDIATINENKDEWLPLDWEKLASFPPDSEAQQDLISAIRGADGFNWGYDPFHYTVPEGSYCVHPEGQIRTLEYRMMVKALNQIGLQVVMDVVYNHTYASGQNDKSVLDRIVPGYYHRLNSDGLVNSSTCCHNTATEHNMMRKLMVDSLITWSTAYKVGGFRIDLMGHHMKADVELVRDNLDSLTLQIDGIDGKKIYIYGEGWDFGEVANNARGINATQFNMAGTGIGTYNDRVRDAVRGGSPFNDKQEQGLATGLVTNPNEVATLSRADQFKKLLEYKDQIRIALAGNLSDFFLIDCKGKWVSGNQIQHNGNQAGYAKQPQEHIPFVSAHDNETLFDAIQYKASSSATMVDRINMQNLALSIVAFSQGVPFFHAGSELLRSKSMDRDSYDSTDWYNAIDWTYQDNNWGHGLPPKDKNGAMWSVIRPLLGNPELAPQQEHILLSRKMFGQLIRIRKSSPLFRLQSAAQIKELIHFHNTGPDQIPGLIVMSIRDDSMNPLDPKHKIIFVLFNSDSQPVRYQLQEIQVDDLSLHPVQLEDTHFEQANFDVNSHSFFVPGRAASVFVGYK